VFNLTLNLTTDIIITSITKKLGNMKMKIVSFNLRNANDANCHSIAERAPRIMQIISEQNADVLGLQEYGTGMKKHIHDKLIEEYGFFETVTNKNISSPVLWKKSRFDCLDKGWLWLSETPNEKSISWDDKYNEERICNWALLKDKQTGKNFVYMNTHFGVGKECTTKSPLIINEYCKKFADLPLIITGDFNMSPDSEGYKNMTANFTDVNTVTANDARITFHAYYNPEKKQSLIDYCFIKNAVCPKNYKLLDITFDGKYPSDHHAIAVDADLAD